VKRGVLRLANQAVARSLAAVMSHRGGTNGVPLTAVPRRLLVVKLVGMGDAVLAASLIEQLKRRQPHMEIGVLAGPATHDVLASCATAAVHTYDPAGADWAPTSAAHVMRHIRAQRYDAVIDFEQHILLIAAFIWVTRIPVRVGLAAIGNPRCRFQTHTVKLTGAQSMWSAYATIVRAIDAGIDASCTMPISINAVTRAPMDAWWLRMAMARHRVVALHLGSGSRAQARRWPVARFAALAQRLIDSGVADAILLTGTPQEQPLVAEFESRFRGPVISAIQPGAGVLSSAVLLQKCALLVSNDTGVMHLAAAMGTPTVGLFGPNSPTRYAPVGRRTAAVYLTNVACSPCIHIHQGVVPECVNPEKGRCLLDIDVETVFHHACDLLAEPSRSNEQRHAG
jgi:heptosyltransferase-2